MTGTQRDKETREQGDRKIGRQGHRETGTQEDRDTERQRDREIEIQGDRETGEREHGDRQEDGGDRHVDVRQ